MKTSDLFNTKRFYVPLGISFLVVMIYLVGREPALFDLAQSPQPVVDQTQYIGSDDPVLNLAAHELALAQQMLNAHQADTALADQAAAPEADAWVMGDKANRPALPVPTGVSLYEPVSVDMENPHYPAPGSRLSLSVPGGAEFTAKVEATKANPNGDYTWTGHLDGFGRDEYPVVMTYGNNSVFATVTTPDGSYTLESVGGSGWIYKNPSEFELSEHNADDFLEIPHEH